MGETSSEDIFPAPLAERIRRGGNIAVAVINDPEKAVPLARALLRGGVEAIELTLRTPCALEAMRRVVAEVPEMLVGAESGLVHVFHRDYVTGAVSRADVCTGKNAEKAWDRA